MCVQCVFIEHKEQEEYVVYAIVDGDAAQMLCTGDVNILSVWSMWVRSMNATQLSIFMI